MLPSRAISTVRGFSATSNNSRCDMQFAVRDFAFARRSSGPTIHFGECRDRTCAQNGGADGIRTHDLLDAIEARSQLRHGPTAHRSGSFIAPALYPVKQTPCAVPYDAMKQA